MIIIMRRTDWPKVKKVYGDFIFYLVTIMKKKTPETCHFNFRLQHKDEQGGK